MLDLMFCRAIIFIRKHSQVFQKELHGESKIAYGRRDSTPPLISNARDRRKHQPGPASLATGSKERNQAPPDYGALTLSDDLQQF